MKWTSGLVTKYLNPDSSQDGGEVGGTVPACCRLTEPPDLRAGAGEGANAAAVSPGVDETLRHGRDEPGPGINGAETWERFGLAAALLCFAAWQLPSDSCFSQVLVGWSSFSLSICLTLIGFREI